MRVIPSRRTSAAIAAELCGGSRAGIRCVLLFVSVPRVLLTCLLVGYTDVGQEFKILKVSGGQRRNKSDYGVYVLMLLGGCHG